MREPRRARTGEPVRAEDFNALLDLVLAQRIRPGAGYAVQEGVGGTVLRLLRRRGGAGPVTLGRDWTISTEVNGSNLNVIVGPGSYTRTTLHPDSTGDAVLCAQSAARTSAATLNNGGSGYGSSTTVGVWVEWTIGSTANTGDGGSLSKATEYALDEAGTVTVVASTSETEASDLPDMVAASTGKGYAYVGKVAIDGSTVPTVTQVLDCPLAVPVLVNVADMVIVSADAENNLIASSNDGGAYLDIAEGGTLTVTDNGNGLTTISD